MTTTGNQKGYSLMELLIAVSLLAILAGFATLSVDFIRKERLASAAKELVADIQKVRMDAMVTGQSSNAMTGSGIRFSDPLHDYVMFNFTDTTGDFAYSGTSEENGVKVRDMQSSLTLEIAASTDPAHNVLMYDRMGLPSRFKAAGSIAANNQTITILLREARLSITRCVRVDLNRIREGFWDGTNCSER